MSYGLFALWPAGLRLDATIIQTSRRPLAGRLTDVINESKLGHELGGNQWQATGSGAVR
jgi:hypothetical protein